MKAADLVEDGLAHQAGHARDAVDADEVDEEVHAAVAGAEVDLFEGAREAGAVRGEGHLVHEAHSLRHEAHHVVQRVRRHFFVAAKRVNV